LDDDDAFALGIGLNLARRQLSFEQIKYLREHLRTIALEIRKTGKTQEEAARIVSVAQSTIAEWETNIANNIGTDNACKPPDLRQSIPKSEHKRIYERIKSGENQEQVAADYKISHQRISQIARLVEARENKPQQTETPPFPDQKYRCLIIDPPWPVKKIEREARPNQGLELDYPTMSLEEIGKLPISDLANSEGCHIFLWVTHKFLPDGLKLFEKWGVKYQCVLTWVKPTGMTPFSWMYSTEHVLFGHIGSLELAKKGCRLDFIGKVREHSRKPDEFYNLVRSVSPEPRIDLFSREKREGFAQWGNQSEQFHVP
jgi:N6-adenosine-specific RNA methylase IME4/DNA-binding XRE family transcriptional regulator